MIKNPCDVGFIKEVGFFVPGMVAADSQSVYNNKEIIKKSYRKSI